MDNLRDSGWVAITERLPEDGQEVLVYCPDGGSMAVLRRQGRSWRYVLATWQIGGEDDESTHWLPLPPPPVEDEKEAPR